ncbi:hypothetical protein BH10BAC5_BH10BAC5_10710 [soil metagenome]
MKKFHYFALFIMLAFTCSLFTDAYAQKNNKPDPLVSGKLSVSPYAPHVETNGNGNNSPQQVTGDVLIGAATSGNSRAPQGSQRYIRTSFLITAQEMSDAGFPSGTAINLIGFKYSAAQSLATTGNFLVYLQNTADVTWNKPNTTWTNGTDGVIDPMTLAHNNPITIPAAIGNFDIPFSGGSTFIYTGGSLYIAYEYQNAAGTLSTGNVAFCNTVLVNGLRNAFSTTTLPTTISGISSFRPYTRLGNPLTDVVEVTQVYTLGKAPNPFGVPFTFSSLVKNNDPAPQTFNVVVTVKDSASGTVRYTRTDAVTGLASGASQEIFYTNYTPPGNENDSITVSIAPQPGETFTGNNTLKKISRINPNTYSYAQKFTNDGGVGFTGATGDFVARFVTNSSNSINQIDVNFAAGGQPFQVGIWDNGGVPGGPPVNNIFTSASQTSAAGVFTVLVSPPVAVTGDFFVGVKQTGTVNVSFAFQTETPIRDSTFYFTSPTGGAVWTDFAPANSFRFMVEPKFALNNDAAATAINQNGTVYYPAGTTSIPMTGVATNFGLLSATFNVSRKIYDNTNALIYNNTFAVSGLTSSSSTATSFPDFTGFTAGATYTITDSSMLGTDQNIANNAITRTFTPNIAKTTCILYADAPSRDSLANQMNTAGFSGSYDMIDATVFTGSFRAWRTVFYLLASTGNWTAGTRDSLKAFLDNSNAGAKKTLAIFGNDLGYNNDPIRNVAALPADTLFYRQYLRNQYVADSWISSVPTSGSKIHGAPGTMFTPSVADSVADPFPDMVKTATWYGALPAFLPVTVTTGDSATAVSYAGANYNVFYGTNVYANYRTKSDGTLDNPVNIFLLIEGFIESNGGILPVELSSFNSSVSRNNVELNWTTTNEQNNNGFDVERKLTSSSSWSKVSFVPGTGNSSLSHSYKFEDKNLATSRYNYRLKQIDVNGNFKYYDLSNEVIVGVPAKFELSQNYPNPFNPATKINYELAFDSKVSVKIFDVTGKEVASLVDGAQAAGYYSINFNASSLSSGVYFYQVSAVGGNQNFVKTLRMMLIK